MHSAVKYIVNELNKPPYNKRFNIVSFDSLSSEDLLQVVSDVLGELDASHKVDLRIEVPEQTIVRILSFLRVLKYRPNSEISPQVFRQGLLNGDKHIIHPILEWLLKNTKDLQKRAYLGKYLVKLEIPNEILTDVDIYNIYEQYESLVENFKAVHKESEAIENSGVNINELRNDLTAMENERDIVIKRLEQMSRKIDNVSNKDQILKAVNQLRLERDKKKEILTQLSDEIAALHSAQQRYNRLSQQLMEIKKATVGATPQSLMSKLEEEIQVTDFIVKDKLASNVAASTKKYLVFLLWGFLISGNIFTVLMMTIGIGVVLCAKLIARVLMLTLYREKQMELVKAGGIDMLKGEDFKDYIAKLKQRNLVYKQNRAVLSALKSETGVLQRTVDLLNAKSQQLGVPEDVSAHINPSVSIAMALTRNISPFKAMMFVAAQCGGGIAGAALLYGCFQTAVMQRIQEREKVGRALKEQHKQMKDSQEQSVRQKLLWTNLLRLFEVKQKSLEALKKNEGTLHLDSEHRVQTLILN
ncbi:intraflagellar transport protein 81 homolog [Diaphorina citri]|uniref:Intraflagellar transport protein 81 homolog n=1 Tax=Diaphorina citri TaxID=121845 RepID=A0A3Q0J1X4_DIACI|nr:intraflagellar transport protein 81 homolog [Diaphorina citri]